MESPVKGVEVGDREIGGRAENHAEIIPDTLSEGILVGITGQQKTVHDLFSASTAVRG
jgi:hypothetical protein